MQDRIKKEWFAGKQLDTINSSEKIAAKENLFKRVSDQERKILRQLLDQVDEMEVWIAIDALIQANRVYIGGLGQFLFSRILVLLHT